MTVQSITSLVWLLLLLLNCCTSRIAALEISRSDPAVPDSVTWIAGHTAALRPLATIPAPEPRIFLEDLTSLGQLIPGHVKTSRCCGIVNHVSTRVVNGTAAARGQFPWMVAFVGENEIPFCAGSLINDRYVLTAGLCFRSWTPSQEVKAILGKYETLQNVGIEVRADIDKVIIHPRFNEKTRLNNDIALVKLKIPLDLPIGDNFIAPICLPSRRAYRNEEAELAGWGTTKDPEKTEDPPIPDLLPQALQVAKLRIVGNAVCRFLNRVGVVFDLIVQPSMTCALGARRPAGPCVGDNGAPLMVPARHGRRRRRSVVGLTSWGNGCATPLFPSVYTRVPWFLDWIIANTKDATFC